MEKSKNIFADFKQKTNFTLKPEEKEFLDRWVNVVEYE